MTLRLEGSMLVRGKNIARYAILFIMMDSDASADRYEDW